MGLFNSNTVRVWSAYLFRIVCFKCYTMGTHALPIKGNRLCVAVGIFFPLMIKSQELAFLKLSASFAASSSNCPKYICKKWTLFVHHRAVISEMVKNSAFYSSTPSVLFLMQSVFIPSCTRDISDGHRSSQASSQCVFLSFMVTLSVHHPF